MWNLSSFYFIYIILASIAGLFLVLSLYSPTNFLYPYSYSLWQGKFLTKKKINIDEHSLRASTEKIKELLLIQNIHWLKKYLFLTSCFAVIITVTCFFTIYAHYINETLHSTKASSYNGSIVIFSSLTFVYFGTFIFSILLKELFHLPIYIIKDFTNCNLTIEQLNKFKEDYQYCGITSTLSLDNLYINILAYSRLAVICSKKNQSADTIRFWQSTILYRELALEQFANKKLSSSISKLINYIDAEILKIKKSKTIKIESLTEYWTALKFSTKQYPYLFSIPEIFNQDQNRKE